jgi:hypothetical protein
MADDFKRISKISKIAKLITEDPYHTLGGKLINENNKGMDASGEFYEISQSGDVFVISYPNAHGSGREFEFEANLGDIQLAGDEVKYDDMLRGKAQYGRGLLAEVSKVTVAAIANVDRMEEGGSFYGAPILSITVDRSDVTLEDGDASGNLRESGRPATDEQMMMICKKITQNHIQYIGELAMTKSEGQEEYKEDFPGYEG